MKNKYDFKRSDIERLITVLDNSINIIRDDIVDLGYVNPADDTGNAGRTQQIEYNIYINTLNNYEAQITVLEEIRRGLVDFLNKIDENVGLKEEKFVFEEDIVSPLLKDLTELIEDRKTYNGVVKEDNWFDLWESTAVCMPPTPTPSEMEIYSKAKAAYNYDRKILDDLNDTLHRGIIGVESLMGEINDDYQLYFFPLEGEELIDTIVNSLNLTIDLDIQDFKESIGEYVEGSVIDIKFNEENIIDNLKLYFGMNDDAAEELLDFYKDLKTSDINPNDISKYFWGIQAGIGDRYNSKPFLLTNGDYQKYNEQFADTYPELNQWLKQGITSALDYQHLCATMSADSNWDNEYISNVANWGMGDGGDSISAIITDDPEKFGLADKNSDSLADSLEATEDSSASFLYLLSKEGTDEEAISEVLQWMQRNQSNYE